MKIGNIETLLLQEMEDVKGGAAGECYCIRGAGQSADSGGTCVCSDSGAGQQSSTGPGLSKCFCNMMGAGQIN